MSSCKCDLPVSLRVSDEGEYGAANASTVAGFTDVPIVRLRCCECGGKAGFAAIGMTTFDGEVERSAEPGDPTHFVQLDISKGSLEAPNDE